ncbi:MAG: indole-3-glycerol-phosphate synthase [Acidobacteria bacterium]|nr:indole-3-glycerol-phosphate synthase [Acidobacteriota bacterium]
MARTYLDDIIAAHRHRASHDTRAWRDRSVEACGDSLRQAIVRHRPLGNAVIAEIKRRSPSKGELLRDWTIDDLGDFYVTGGASAISVLTDTDHFGGSVSDLTSTASRVSLPILRKDFTVSINDVLDTAEMGASCVLLIVAALSSEELAELTHVAGDIGLDCLVEVHDEAEAWSALEVGASMIGVNQRDLHTFEVDPDRAQRVAASLPDEVIRVAESGFHSSEQVALAAAAGFDAVLVGEAFVTAADPVATLRSFVGHPIGGR